MVDNRPEYWTLVCNLCDARFTFAPLFRGCPRCAAHSEIGVLDFAYIGPAKGSGKQIRNRRRGVADYRDLLPGGEAPDWITLGEGGTPCIRSRYIGPQLGLSHVYFKCEGANPTGSFKDRFVVVSINIAKQAGFSGVVSGSTGNLGVSVAAYATAAGLDCIIIVPNGISPEIVAELRRFGARVFITSVDQRIETFERVVSLGRHFPISASFRRPIQNPFGIEGYKTFAYEITSDLQEAPRYVIFPCARGNGLHGCWKGFLDCLRLGWSATLPSMIATQPKGANPIEVSLAQGLPRSIELPRVSSIAQSTAETVASDHALRSIRESAGLAVSCSDSEIIDAAHLLTKEGLSVEPSSALPIAGLRSLASMGTIQVDAPIVCVLTATGLRWPLPPPETAPDATRVTSPDAVLDMV